MKQPPKTARNRYSVIPRTLVFIRSGRATLFKKGRPGHSLWPGKLNGVGGHVEPGETVLQAAMREVMEETGLSKLEQLCLRGVIAVDPEDAGSPGVMLFVFTAYSKAKTVHASEEGDLTWLDWRTVPEHMMVEDLPALLRRLDGNGHRSTPFFAHYEYSPEGKLTVTFT